jgi:alpha-L-rhamnosidase
MFMKNESKSLSCLIAVLVVILFISCHSEKGSGAPFDLTLSEGFSNPIGFYDESPAFSWKLPAGMQSQKAYYIVVASSPDLLPGKADLWNSGKIETDQTLFVKYEGEKLNSRQKVFWKAEVLG